MVAFVSIGTRSSTASGTTLTPVIQAQAAGDLLLAVVAVSVAGTTLNTPAGWTQLFQSNTSNSFDVGIWFKISTGSDSNPVFTWTGTAAATSIIARFNGSSGVGAIAAQSSGTVNPHTSASFNSTAGNSLAVAIDFQGVNATEANTPAGWTSAAVNFSNTAGISNAIWTLQLGASGSASGAISQAEAAVTWTQIQFEMLDNSLLLGQACL